MQWVMRSTLHNIHASCPHSSHCRQCRLVVESSSVRDEGPSITSKIWKFKRLTRFVAATICVGSQLATGTGVRSVYRRRHPSSAGRTLSAGSSYQLRYWVIAITINSLSRLRLRSRIERTVCTIWCRVGR